MENVKVPEKCLCCDADWKSGVDKPKEDLSVGKIARYKCGHFLILHKTDDWGHHLLVGG